jgi:hypothetical protein
MVSVRASAIKVGDHIHGLGKISRIEAQPKQCRKPQKVEFSVEGIDHPYVRKANDIFQIITPPLRPQVTSDDNFRDRTW